MKTLKLFVHLFLAIAVAMFTQVATGSDTAAAVVGVGYLASPFFIETEAGVLYTSFSMSDLPAKLKDYYIELGLDVVLMKIMLGGRPDYFNLLTGVVDEVPLTELTIGSIVRPGGVNTFDPVAGAVGYKARIGKTRHAKVDLLLQHTFIMNAYKSYRAKVIGGQIDPFKVPFEAELMTAIMTKASQEIRQEIIFKGKYNASGTTARAVADGILFKVITDVESNAIPAANRTAGAAITSSNAYDEVRKLVTVVTNNPDYANEPMILLLSPAKMLQYEEDYAATRGTAFAVTSWTQRTVEGTNIMFKVEPGMQGSDRLICTPARNLYYMVNEESQQNNIRTQEFNRDLKLMMDFHIGVEYGIAEEIFVNQYSGIDSAFA